MEIYFSTRTKSQINGVINIVIALLQRNLERAKYYEELFGDI